MYARMHACMFCTDGTWMLWQKGWGLGGRYHGWDMDALAERLGPGRADVINMDALWQYFLSSDRRKMVLRCEDDEYRRHLRMQACCRLPGGISAATPYV